MNRQALMELGTPPKLLMGAVGIAVTFMLAAVHFLGCKEEPVVGTWTRDTNAVRLTNSTEAILADGERVIQQLEDVTKRGDTRRSEKYKRERDNAINNARIGFIYHAVGRSWDETSNAVWSAFTTVYEIKE